MTNMTFKANILPYSSSITLGSEESGNKWHIYTTTINNVGSTVGDMLYWSAAGTPAQLPIGSTGQVLQIDNNGVPIWATISTNISEATSTTNGLMSAEDKIKLDNINNTINDAISASLNLTLSDISDVTTIAAEVNVLDGITATTAELNYCDGVTSNIQTQLNDKAASSHTHSSYVNQNAFSNIVVGSTTIAADNTTDTLTLVAGSNITLTPDATNDKITITKTNNTYAAATTSTAGLMSAADKVILDSLATRSTSMTKLSVGTKNSTTTCTIPAGHTGLVCGITTTLASWNMIIPLSMCSSKTRFARNANSQYFTFYCQYTSSTRTLTFYGNTSFDMSVYSF